MLITYRMVGGKINIILFYSILHLKVIKNDDSYLGICLNPLFDVVDGTLGVDELQLLPKLRELNFHIIRAARHSWKKVKLHILTNRYSQLKDSIRAT
jgi:hypothetical protein